MGHSDIQPDAEVAWAAGGLEDYMGCMQPEDMECQGRAVHSG